MTTRILLLTHAPLASALRECALHVFADGARDLLAIDVSSDEAPEETLERALALLGGQGGLEMPTLVLTDLFGATPCNVAQRLTGLLHARLVAGVNLPMLLRSIGYRHETLDELVSRAMIGGGQGVMQVASSSRQNQSQSARPFHDQDEYHHQQ